MSTLHRLAAVPPVGLAPAWDKASFERYCGPDRRSASPPLRHWLAAALEELDYGVLLLTRDAEVLHANYAAVAELDTGHPLQRVGRHLRAQGARDAMRLEDALRNASLRRLRRLVTFGDAANSVVVSVVPLVPQPESEGDASNAGGTGNPGGTGGAPILLVLGKRQVCESLSVQGFASSHRLTAAETRVLAALCSGLPPSRIAAELGVAISTVRTQIGMIRSKTGAENIRSLVRQVAQLPPLMGVLRPVASAAAERTARAMPKPVRSLQDESVPG